jgi:hypothetical protein
MDTNNFNAFRRWLVLSGVALATLILFSIHAVDAYQTALDAQAIGEAYVLGQRNDKTTADFVAPYISQVTQEGLDSLHRAVREHWRRDLAIRPGRTHVD